MAAEIDIDQTVVINFAQKLAGNEATLRNRAVKKLRKWIVSKSNATKGGLNHDDLLKLWKGLHYCMWMSDKPLVQEELSRNLSSLVHSFKDIKGAMTFIDAGLETEAREWGKIDKLRLDKFMMFVRNILQESLLVMQKHKYKVHALKKLTEVFSKTVCSIDKEEIPDGIRFHFADIYVSEIERICAKEVKSKQITVLLEPYVSMITETKNFSVAEHVAKQVFEELGEKVVDAALQQAEEEEEEEVDKENAPTLEIDLSKVADLLFARASEKNTLTRNRNLIYSIVTKLRNILEGNVGEEEDMEEGEEEDLEADIEKAVSRLEKFNKTLVDKPEKRKRKSSESEEPKNNKKIKAEKVVKTKKMERNENKKQKSAEKKVKKKSDPVQKAAKKDTIKDNLFEGGFFDSDEEDTSKTEVKTKASNSENKKDKNKNKVDTEPQNPGALNSDQTISNHMEGKTKKRRKSNVEKGNICIETNGTPAAEAVQEAKRSPTPNKKKRRKSDIMKETESETSENLSNTPNSEEKPGVCIEKVTQSGKKNRRKSEKIEEKDLPVTTASETAVNENIAVSPANSVSSSKKQKRRNSVLSTSVGTVSPSSETVQASNHSVSDQSLVPSLKNSLKKKRKSMGGIDAPKENVAARSKEAEDIKLGNAAGAEEEIEIWIPSKKYKGALKGKHEQQQESAAAAKSAARGEVFAQFQSGVKTPAAFVRKAMNKVATPKTEQGKKKQAESTETPGSSAGGKKRLSFVLHKNQAQSIYGRRTRGSTGQQQGLSSDSELEEPLTQDVPTRCDLHMQLVDPDCLLCREIERWTVSKIMDQDLTTVAELFDDIDGNTSLTESESGTSSHGVQKRKSKTSKSCGSVGKKMGKGVPKNKTSDSSVITTSKKAKSPGLIKNKTTFNSKLLNATSPWLVVPKTSEVCTKISAPSTSDQNVIAGISDYEKQNKMKEILKCRLLSVQSKVDTLISEACKAPAKAASSQNPVTTLKNKLESGTEENNSKVVKMYNKKIDEKGDGPEDGKYDSAKLTVDVATIDSKKVIEPAVLIDQSPGFEKKQHSLVSSKNEMNEVINEAQGNGLESIDQNQDDLKNTVDIAQRNSCEDWKETPMASQISPSSSIASKSSVFSLENLSPDHMKVHKKVFERVLSYKKEIDEVTSQPMTADSLESVDDGKECFTVEGSWSHKLGETILNLPPRKESLKKNCSEKSEGSSEGHKEPHVENKNFDMLSLELMRQTEKIKSFDEMREEKMFIHQGMKELKSKLIEKQSSNKMSPSDVQLPKISIHEALKNLKNKQEAKLKSQNRKDKMVVEQSSNKMSPSDVQLPKISIHEALKNLKNKQDTKLKSQNRKEKMFVENANKTIRKSKRVGKVQNKEIESDDSDCVILDVEESNPSFERVKHVKAHTLYEEDVDVLTSGAWLSDMHINLAQALLKKQFPDCQGLENCGLATGKICNFSVAKSSGDEKVSPFVQLFNTKDIHWICITNIGCEGKEDVRVYDSHFRSLFTDARVAIAQILGHEGQNVTVAMPPFQKQPPSDCGVFAIACATTLLNGRDPTTITFDTKLMRKHLLDCFEKQQLLPFPESTRTARKLKAAKFVVNLARLNPKSRRS